MPVSFLPHYSHQESVVFVTACKNGQLLDGLTDCLGRAEANCNAWTWCDDPGSCTDELLTQIPYHGCQLKWDPHEPWGVPADELSKDFRPSVLVTGYVKSEPRSSIL